MMTRILLLVLALGLNLAAAETKAPRVVFIVGEPEYESARTLPAFGQYLQTNFGFNYTVLERHTNNSTIPGLKGLEQADLVFLFVRRMTLPEDELAIVRQYLKSGKPLIGLRTASHAFQTWLKLDPEVLGGNYHNHYNNKILPTITVEPQAASHPILKNVPKEFSCAGTLYKNAPIATNSTILLMGTITGQPPEPVAWTHDYNGSHVFYSSLGHQQDFENPAFRRMLLNAVFWALDRPAPSGKP